MLTKFLKRMCINSLFLDDKKRYWIYKRDKYGTVNFFCHYLPADKILKIVDEQISSTEVKKVLHSKQLNKHTFYITLANKYEYILRIGEDF